MSGRLEGKVAVVTGGSAGIGRASAERFAAEGAKVVVGDIRDDWGQELEEQFPGVVLYRHADVTEDGAVEGLVTTAVEEFGRLDVMFNNAGTGGDPTPILDTTVEGFEQTMRLLVTAPVQGHKYAARVFKEMGIPGSIITTSSVAGIQGNQSALAYTVAKHALIGLVREATAELAPFGIRSNAICPGITMTAVFGGPLGLDRPQIEELNELLAEKLKDKQPIGRVGYSEDIANAALFLASDESNWLTGAVIPVDGGQTAISMNGWLPVIMGGMGEYMASRAAG